MSHQVKDSFETWVAEHRETFDVFEPSDDLLHRFEATLPTLVATKVVPFWTTFRLVAAAVALLCIGTFAGVQWSKSSLSNPSLSSISPELAKAETYYAQRVSASLAYLSEVAPNQTDVPTDIKALETDYEALREALKTAPRNTHATIIKRMIANYQLRLGMLERVLQYHQDTTYPSSPQKEREHEPI